MTLSVVTNTHRHSDHTSGNAELLSRTGAAFLDVAELPRLKEIAVDGARIAVFPTPGHTMDSVCFYAAGTLITGDTLFNATVGNCFSGDLTAFFGSIQRLLAYPPETVICAGHDYVTESIAFARTLEPGNPFFEDYLSGYNPQHVRSSLAEELQVNPYLRFNEAPIVSLLRSRGLKAETGIERWMSLMNIA
jgi:hydroxyacylglutathione hydrolase